MEPKDEIYPLDLASRAIRNWPWIVGLSLLGALIGLIYSALHPPLYEAQAVLGVTINYTVTEPLELGVEDRSLDRVAAFIQADRTIQRAFDEVPDDLRREHGWTLEADSETALRLEQRLSEWWLVVTDPNPDLATEIANAWAESALELLDEASLHAWRAAALMNGRYYDVECNIVEGSDPHKWQCQVLPLELEPEALAGSLQTELAASHGILPVVSYELLRSASPPEQPVLWRRGTLVLAGSIAGFIIGAAIGFLRTGTNSRPAKSS